MVIHMTNADIDKIIDRAIDKAEKRFAGKLQDTRKELKNDTELFRKQSKKDAELSRKQFNEDMQRYIGALTEDSNYKIAAVAEQYLGLNEKVDDIARVANATFEEVGIMRVELTEALDQLKNHDKRITVLETRVR